MSDESPAKAPRASRAEIVGILDDLVDVVEELVAMVGVALKDTDAHAAIIPGAPSD